MLPLSSKVEINRNVPIWFQLPYQLYIYLPLVVVVDTDCIFRFLIQRGILRLETLDTFDDWK